MCVWVCMCMCRSVHVCVSGYVSECVCVCMGVIDNDTIYGESQDVM